MSHPAVPRRVLAGVAAAGLALGVSACGSSRPRAATFAVSAFEANASGTRNDPELLGGNPVAPSRGRGTAHVAQSGDHLSGWLRLTGLVAGSRHAALIYGPTGYCYPGSKQSLSIAVVLPDAVANAQGDSYETFDILVHQDVVTSGFYVEVGERPTPASERSQINTSQPSAAFTQALTNDPGILCGDIPKA